MHDTPDLRIFLYALILAALGATTAAGEEDKGIVCGATTPFLTVEAESATNKTTGRTVMMSGLPTPKVVTPEMEASNRGFVELAKPGEELTIPVARAANAFVLRHCIPDAPTGGGQSATLSLYVNGKFRQSLPLSSRYNWLYGEGGQNGQSEDPAAGQPHVFWNEERYRIAGASLKPGDTLQLRKGAKDEAAFYRLDLIDLETAPDPLPTPKEPYLSVTDFGANGSDTADDTPAILACIAAAKAQKKTVWIPAGTYYQSAKFVLDGVTVQGAGVWHTNLIGNVPEKGFGGALGFTLRGDGATVRDLYIESATHTRRSMEGGKPFTAAFNNCTHWRVQNVWMTHVHVAFWMSGVQDGVVRGCRVRCTYADGININRGSIKNVVENNHVRGTGDDGIAFLSEVENTPTASRENTARANTVVATWWGHNLDVAGGSGHVVENNLLADNPLFGCLTINLPRAFPMHPLTNTVLRNNRIVRGGGNYVGQRRGAVWLFADSTEATGIVMEGNEILVPIFRGIHLSGAGRQEITFINNRIESPGQDAIAVDKAVKGKGVFTGNTVRGLKPEFQPLNQSTNTEFVVVPSGNSWQ